MDMSSSAAGVSHEHHKHGSWGGHILPGSFFVLWSLWWFVNVSSIYIHRTQRKKQFKARATYRLSLAPNLPLEPLLKVVLCFIGILGELYLSHHAHWRTLYHDDGAFWSHHLNNWQHTAMFSAFIVSGIVDLIGHRMQLPPATEHAFLGLAFVIEGLLLAFHLKGNPLEIRVHFLLVLLVAACAVTVFLEAALPTAALLSFARSFFVLLQGLWFCQAGNILFLGNPAWSYSDDYMGGFMFLPVVFVTHIMVASMSLLGVYLLVAYKMAGRGSGQRGLEAIERANDAPPVKVALLDLSNKADRAALMHHPVYMR